MNLQELLHDPPNLHRDSTGNPTSWQLDDTVLDFIDRTVNESTRTLETGAGVSTILFAIKRTHHTCIVPDEGQVTRITEYCERHSLETDRISFEIDGSENALPQLGLGELDFVLIDGRHAFPTPFIDWYYTSAKLKVGGICIIDDTHLWTGEVLRKFLISEPEWTLTRDFPRTAAFTKLMNGSHAKEWVQQPYLIRNSATGIRREQMRFAIKLLRTGKWSRLISSFRRSSLRDRAQRHAD